MVAVSYTALDVVAVSYTAQVREHTNSNDVVAVSYAAHDVDAVSYTAQVRESIRTGMCSQSVMHSP